MFGRLATRLCLLPGGGGLLRALLAGLALLPAARMAVAHSDPEAPVPSLRALKVDEPLTVDGVLDEPFWTRCAAGGEFIDTRTRAPAAEQTTVRVAYTRQFLYVGVECLDSAMSAIHATERRDDRAFVGDDWVEVHFDPPHNHRGKYAFYTNPLGTRADGNEGPSGQFNYGWSADWDCAARLGPDRWVFEMRIPLKVLNYFRRDGETWGFNVTRMQRRTDVTSFWSFNATDVYKPRHFGHLIGLELADAVFDRNWEITPYVSARADFNGDTDAEFNYGGDLKFRLTPAVITSWTVKPDFGQVESDDDTIELRDTERFLPEKRLFFEEGDELIRMPHRLYYSRRFTTLDGAGKASGLLPGLSFNVQNILGDVVHDGDFHGDSTVVRVNQDIRQRSSLSYYAAGSALEQGHAVAGSVDGYFFLTDAWRYRFQVSVADEDLDPGSTGPPRRGTDYLGSSSMIYSLYPWTVELTYNAITDGFNPLLGYIPRRDIFGPTAYAEYHPRSGTAWYKDLLLSYLPRYYETGSGDTSVRDHDLLAAVILQNDLGLRAGYDHEYHQPYHNWRGAAGVDIFASDYYKAINLTWATGEFEQTDYNEVLAAKRIKFWERLPIRWEFNVRFEDDPATGQDTVWLNRLVFDFFIMHDMWVKTSLQLRDSGIHNYSVIYAWRLRHNTYWYVVYNDVNDGVDEPGTSLFTKIAYTF